MAEDVKNIPKCGQCKHYFVTWNPGFPHGCRAFGFKSKILPYLEVRSASQHACLKFEAKKSSVRS